MVVKSMSSQVASLSKVVHYMHPPTLGISLVAKVVHYEHPSIFNPPWIEEQSQEKDFKQSACWEATQPNQI